MSSSGSALLTLGHTGTDGYLQIFSEGHLVKKWTPRRTVFAGLKSTKPRGPIRKLSKKASKRMRDRLLQMRKSEPFLFVTLTYGAVYPASGDAAKQHLNKLWRSLVRRWPQASTVWVMQFQKRGAPHFHLVVWGIKARALRDWIKEAWPQIATEDWSFVDSAGARVENGRSLKGVANYLSRPSEVPEAFLGTEGTLGRLWGQKNKSALPFSPVKLFKLKDEAGLDRLVRRYIKSQSREKRSKGVPGSVQVHDPARFADCLSQCGLIQNLDRDQAGVE